MVTYSSNLSRRLAARRQMERVRMSVSDDETRKNMENILNFCGKTLNLSVQRMGEILFALAVQVRYAQVSSKEDLYKQCEQDCIEMMRLAEASFDNHKHLRGE